MSGQDLGRSAEASRAMATPEVPYYDWNVCPGEGCSYKEWVATKVVPVFDSYKVGRRGIAQLKAGDKVLGITGVVITFKPGVIHMDRDLPNKGLSRGDTILTYAYRGEGNSAVWLKGRYVSDYDISFATYPDGSGCARPPAKPRILIWERKSGGPR
jgi:hypothetical protein